MLGWLRGRAGQAYFVTDRHRVIMREFLTTLFETYGVTTSIPDLDADAAQRELPVPFRWFFGQTLTLRTDKAVADLGYRPIVSQSEASKPCGDRFLSLELPTDDRHRPLRAVSGPGRQR